MRLFPKKRDFLKMLAHQAVKTKEGMAALRDFIEEATEEKGNRVKEIEKEADEARRVLVEELTKSFVTPIDREDIFALSRVIDDMVDYAKSTVEEMLLFKVETNEHLKKMNYALCECAQHLSLAVEELKRKQKSCLQHLMRAKKVENYVEHLYHEALAELFQSKDFIHILKLREIYGHLSNAADRGDEAANIIGDIVVKIT
jgi:hypothetical protein